LTEEQLEMMGDDPNWYCEHCNSGNTSDDTLCRDCGAPKGSSPTHQTTRYEESELPRSEEEAAAKDTDDSPVIYPEQEESQAVVFPFPLIESLKESENYRIHTAARSSPLYAVAKRISQPGVWLFAVVPLGVLLVGWFVYLFFFKSHTEAAIITGFHWNRVVVVEEYTTLHESGWSIPAGGRETDSVWKDTGRDEKVTDGWTTEEYLDTCYRPEYQSKTCYEDKGNGAFSPYECGGNVDVPYSCTKTRPKELYHYEDVYDWFYYYDIERWVEVGRYPTQGKDQDPFYHRIRAGSNQRRIELPGVYEVNFQSDNEEIGEFTRAYELSSWLELEPGSEHELVVNTFNVVLEIK
jgi:hypothetical protein